MNTARVRMKRRRRMGMRRRLIHHAVQWESWDLYDSYIMTFIFA